MSEEVNEESAEAPEPQTPLLRIVKGDPTVEEVAALVAVVSAMAAGSTEGDPSASRTRSAWSAHHHKLRVTHRHGPDVWRLNAR